MKTFSEINDATGFANGIEFSSETEVREYFTVQNLKTMFGACKWTQTELNEMAETVVANGWHLATPSNPTRPRVRAQNGETHMKTQEHALQLKAKEALKYFSQVQRSVTHDRAGELYWITVPLVVGEPIPQWITNLCHDAHGDMLPDDWKYEFIVEALNALADNENADDICMDADIYTAELTAWLASHLDRVEYCNQFLSELDGEPANMCAVLMNAQAMEKHDVLASVRQSLEKQITE